MASSTSITIQNTLDWLTAFILQRPTIGIGNSPGGLEPALTTANMVMQMILQPPFVWSWNRTVLTTAFTTSAGVSDYSVSLPTYGFLENATLVNANATGQTPPNTPLEIFSILAKEGKQNKPNKIAVILDDDNGNITFRVFPVPDAIYTVDLDFQRAPVLATALGATTWAPIPDRLAFLYERAMMAQLMLMYNSQLYMQNIELFFRQLVSAAEGLTETQKAIFLEDSLRIARTRAASALDVQQGKGARS